MNEGTIMKRAQKLYQASLNGDIPALITLIHEDPLILHKAPNVLVDESPLHTAAIRGDIKFTRAILDNAPHLARERDSLGYTPLHWASALGHLDIVRELLKSAINKDICLINNHDGKNLLHLAVIKGKVQVIPAIYRANSDAAREKMDEDTIFHLCVKHHNLDSLKILMELIGRDMEFIFSKDNNSNTILHLATFSKQLETIKYVISLDFNKEYLNLMNGHGLTALDVIDYCPRDLKGIDIWDLLVQGGIKRAKDLIHHLSSSSLMEITTEETTENLNEDHAAGPALFKKFRHKVRTCMARLWQIYLESNSAWLETARGNIMVVATLITAVAFQAGMNPPGGVWQESKGNYTAGKSIAYSKFHSDYAIFLGFNILSVLVSSAVILLVISGYPLKNRFSILMLVIGVAVAIIFLLVSYILGLCILISTQDYACGNSPAANTILSIFLIFVIIVLLFHSIGFMHWFFIKLKKGVKAIKKWVAD